MRILIEAPNGAHLHDSYVPWTAERELLVGWIYSLLDSTGAKWGAIRIFEREVGGGMLETYKVTSAEKVPAFIASLVLPNPQ